MDKDIRLVVLYLRKSGFVGSNDCSFRDSEVHFLQIWGAFEGAHINAFLEFIKGV